MPPISYEQAREVKQRYEAQLMGLANVVGIGVGLRQKGGEFTNEIALIVMVKQKLEEGEMNPEDIVPAELDGVTIDVQQVGEIHAGD